MKNYEQFLRLIVVILAIKKRIYVVNHERLFPRFEQIPFEGPSEESGKTVLTSSQVHSLHLFNLLEILHVMSKVPTVAAIHEITGLGLQSCSELYYALRRDLGVLYDSETRFEAAHHGMLKNFVYEYDRFFNYGS